MKFFNIALLFVVLVLSCSCTFADDESQLPAVKRISLRRPIGKAAKPTTTTTTQAPQDFDEGDYQDENPEGQYNEESEEPSSTTTTTTEAPKKVIGPVIRPFRSNDDFLNSLKRRQMNAKKHRSEKVTIKPTKAAPSEELVHEAEESAPAPAPAPVPPKKKTISSPYNRNRKFTKPAKPEPQDEDAAAEESEQQQKEEIKPRRPLGRLALRRN